MLSLVLLAAAIAAFVSAVFVLHSRDFKLLGGLFGIFAFPAFFGSLILAVIALIECIKYPERYPRGQAPAIISLTLGCTLIAAYFIGHASRRSRMANATGETGQSTENSQDVIKFNHLNFVFHPPVAPWKQVAPKRLSQSAILAFARQEPMGFTVNVIELDSGDLAIDPLKRLAELSMDNVRHNSTSHQLLGERAKARNNLPGWETEMQLVSDGHEFYAVDWLLATNGFGYQLGIWGPISLKSEVQREADKVFAGFELVAPEK